VTALGEDAPNVVGLVCIAGFALDEGRIDRGLAGTRTPTPAIAHLDTDEQGFAFTEDFDTVDLAEARAVLDEADAPSGLTQTAWPERAGSALVNLVYRCAQLVRLLCDPYESLDWQELTLCQHSVGDTCRNRGRPESMDRLGESLIIRVNPYLATAVQFSSMLDKLGVTGSSPVPPTSHEAA
jgi:hypothetical protein